MEASADAMNALNVTLLVLYAGGMSVGQVLFKLAADRSRDDAARGFLGALLRDGYFLTAIAIYACLTLLWVWILTRVPLSRAYPFVVLSFAFTPALASWLFGESIGLWYLAGLGLVVSGLAILVWKAG
ncbi:MAG: transporter [Candidatus Levyibacteriota bacterium]